jgi:two-component system chemotaxis sensor kinase CheA
MTDALNVEEFITGYLAEAEEHLSAARSCLMAIDEALRKKENNPKAVRELFRALHTLKGLSAMVGAEPIVDVAHELETLLRSADKAGGKLPPRAVDEIQKGLQAIQERVASLARGEPLVAVSKSLLEALAALQFDALPARPSARLSLDADLLAKLSLAEQEQLLQGLARGRRAVRVDFASSQARSAAGLNITSVRARISALGELVKVLPRSVASPDGGRSVAFVLLLVTDASDAAIAEAAAATPADVIALEAAQDPDGGADAYADLGEEPLDLEMNAGAKRNFVRVDVSRLDAALEGLSALVVTRSRMQRALNDLAQGRGGIRELTNIVAEGGPQLRDLRAAIMRARMVPVMEMLDRTTLLVRGLSRSSGKLVRLGIDAGSSELDKAVADRLFPAIVHLIRNAVDHAIELPAERKALGKPEEGQLRIRCSERSASQLAMTVSDDGRGIDREKVAKRAGVGVPKDDAELLALITRPGLSTRDQADHISGRGLGMDIVKRIVVDELGGELKLRTHAGLGSEFTVVVPLSVTIVDVFSFVSGERTFVVPVSTVEELAEIGPDVVTHAPHPGAKGEAVRLLKHRGFTLPLFTLTSLLGVAGAEVPRPKAIIVRHDEETFAVQVDRMLGQQEVVVRPLKDPLVDVPGLSGSTDLGDGKPTLVLDLLSLMRNSVSAKAAVVA